MGSRLKIKNSRYINEKVNIPDSVKSKKGVSFVQYDTNMGIPWQPERALTEEQMQRPLLNRRQA